MKNKKQNEHHSRQGVAEMSSLAPVFYDGQPVPEWLQYPIMEQQQQKEPEKIPDWVLEAVRF